MNDAIETLYPQIASALMTCVPAGWTKVTIDMQVKPVVLVVKGYYTDEIDGSSHSLSVSKPLFALLKTLHYRMKTETHDNWDHAVYELSRDGKFELKLEYPND